jgi:uncharacterized protein YjdB
MFDRISPRLLLLIGIALPIAGCTNPLVDTISVSPTTQSVSVGQTVQFDATGTVGHGSNHPSTTQDITDSATWTSSVPGVATVNSSGVATGVSAGTTTITASMNGYTGVVSASATLTVTGGSGTGVPSGATLVSISIIPSTQSVAVPTQTSQFIAIGTLSSGATINATNVVTWSSSSQQIATIGATTGLATAVGQGTVTITALYTSNGTTLTATASFTVMGGTTEEYTALTIIPGSQSVTASGGETGAFIALATSGTTGLEVDVTNSPQLTWTSTIPTIATITSGQGSGNGVATGVSQGTSTIVAQLTNPDGSLVSANASLDVTLSPAPEPLLSLTIVPSTITVDNLLDQGQFLAIGTYSTTPTVRDLTNSVEWLTSAPSVFPVNSNGTGVPSGGANAGIVTAYGVGSATIIAEATDPKTGSIETATATFMCPLVLPTPTTAGSCYPGSEASALLATLTVYNEGLNTTDWLVTASSATGTPDVMHCGPGSSGAGFGGSVCVATYPVGSLVVLDAQATGAQFGGWSYNCVPSDQFGNTGAAPPITAAGPNYCVVSLTYDDTVGAIFN